MVLKAEWVDHGREPQCPPDPAFPNGINVDLSNGAAKTCSVDLGYPARRCGIYVIRCNECGFSTALTTAGRPDDPRHVTVGCYSHVMDPNPPGMTEIIPPNSPRIKRTPA